MNKTELILLPKIRTFDDLYIIKDNEDALLVNSIKVYALKQEDSGYTIDENIDFDIKFRDNVCIVYPLKRAVKYCIKYECCVEGYKIERCTIKFN